MPYSYPTQSVAQTPTFLTQAKQSGLTDDELQEIVAVIAADPQTGAKMAGTGGARKLRHAREGQGQSGGFRTIHYLGGDDIPVFALASTGKTKRAISQKPNETNWPASFLSWPMLIDRERIRYDLRKRAYPERE